MMTAQVIRIAPEHTGLSEAVSKVVVDALSRRVAEGPLAVWELEALCHALDFGDELREWLVNQLEKAAAADAQTLPAAHDCAGWDSCPNPAHSEVARLATT